MRALVMILAVYLAAIVQTTVSPALRLFGASPHVLILVALAIVLMSESPYGFLWAGWIGLIHDLTSSGALGPCMFWLSVAGYALGKLRQQVYAEHSVPQAALIAVGTAVALAGLTATRQLLGEASVSAHQWYSAVAGGAVYTGIVAAPVLAVVWRWRRPGITWT